MEGQNPQIHELQAYVEITLVSPCSVLQDNHGFCDEILHVLLESHLICAFLLLSSHSRRAEVGLIPHFLSEHKIGRKKNKRNSTWF